MTLCPLCMKSSDLLAIKKKGDYSIVYCKDCNLQFTDPMAHTDQNFYQSSIIYENRSTVIDPTYILNDWRYKTFFLLNSGQPNMILDVGCGDGAFLSLARDKGFNVFGIDIDERAVSIAKDIRKINNVQTGSWDKIVTTEGWNNFDTITLFDVFEHVHAPKEMLTELFDLLKNNGRIFLSVPHLDRYPPLFDIEIDAPPHHLTFWTGISLRKALETAGFKNISIIEKPLSVEDILLHPIWWSKRFIRMIRKPADTQTQNSNISGETEKILQRVKIKRTTKKIIFKSLSWLDYVFQKTHFGRGYTLMATGQKIIS